MIAFETATLVFNDPFAATRRDESSGSDERWITIGAVEPGLILLVVHIHFERDGEEVIRIISARKAESHERNFCAEALKGSERRHKKLRAKRDEDIDFSDAPLVLDWSKAEIGKFYRPPKKPVTMRLDSDVIEWLKSNGPGYQTKANWLLRSAMLHFEGKPAGRSSKRRRRTR